MLGVIVSGYSPVYEGMTNYTYIAVYGKLYGDDNIILQESTTPFSPPQFIQSDEEIQTLDFVDLLIDPNDYGFTDNLYLKILEVTNVVENSQDVSQNIYYYNDLTFTLNNKSRYYTEFLDTQTYHYEIPYSALKLKKDKSYYFILTSSKAQIQQTVGEIIENDTIFAVVLADTQNIVTTQDEILNSIINNNPSDNTYNEIDNNLPRPSYEDSQNNINIPGMNVNIPNDITTNSFNYIFNTIYNAIITDPQPIVFNIPFTNHSLTIYGDFLDNALDQFTTEVVGGFRNPIKDFIHAFYYFIIAYYIINDIRKTIEKVKTGDIMTHTDTNIKADML